jgi:cytochrome P450
VLLLLLLRCCLVCRCLIACSPDVQSRLHDELDAAGLTSRAFEAADVAALPYLGNVIKEAMRVNPTVPQVNRWV